MSFLSKIKYLIILFVLILSCGAGYEGKLPGLISPGETTSFENELNEIPPPIKPLASVDPTPVYKENIIRQNKYSKYQKDLDPLKSKLESLRTTMLEIDDNHMQILCAKANIISLYVDQIKNKYSKKPERFYESYKLMLVMDKNINDTVNYWKTTRQYMRMIYKSASVRRKEEAIYKKKFDKALQSVDAVLEILKDDLQKGAF